MSVKGVEFCFGASVSAKDGSAFATHFDAVRSSAVDAAKWISENASKGTSGFGWFDLPSQDVSSVEETASWLAGCDAIVHVGIGGSALGNLMLHQALLPMYFNEDPRDANGKRRPAFYLADNPDPDKALAIYERVKGKKVALVGVSKSGSTAETMSQFLWFRSMLERDKGGSIDKDILVITDPKGGVFRKFASALGCRSLVIPPSVGGRYSVLTPCGLVTAAALGADIRSLLAGAQEMKDHISSCAPENDPAIRLAAHHTFHAKHGRSMAVMMPYANRLETFAEWFAQLWGESLGKDGLGTTPVRALGAIDQHSQVQLYTAGPDDKFYTLIDAGPRREEITLPEIKEESLSSLSYLTGQKMGEMLRCEARSTAAALVKADRPTFWVSLDEVSPRTIGALVFYFEYVTAMTGRMMGIDPFDQPGVEQGKKYTYGMMGRDGFSADAKEADELFGRVKGK